MTQEEETKMRELATQIISGRPWIQIDERYHLVNEKVNRKTAQKFECKVIKPVDPIVAEDMINIYGILMRLAEVRVLDFSIIFENEENIQSMTLKLTIGVEKSNDQLTIPVPPLVKDGREDAIGLLKEVIDEDKLKK